MAQPYHRGPVSDHFDGTRFFNPGEAPQDRSLAQVLGWVLGTRRVPWPERVPSPFQDTPPPRVDGLRIVLVGHASLLVQAAGTNLLVDPVWSERASPFRRLGPRRVNPPGIAFEALPEVHAVLLTHNHYDHCDLDTLKRLAATHRPRIIAPLGTDASIAQAGLAIEGHDWGDTLRVGSLDVTLTRASHWSARGTRDRRMALWCGYGLGTPSGFAYLAGDSGYGGGAPFRAVRERFGAPRVAVLPIGAYEPRWFMQAQHMNPGDAVEAYRILEPAQALGYHWGTFRLTDEAQDDPPRALRAALAAAGIEPSRFLALRPGEVWQA